MKLIVENIIKKQQVIDTLQWVPSYIRLPEEYLCKDGEYDPSEEVLCQLKSGSMKFSRYWNHRRCKDTIITQPWLELEEWDEVIAWRKKPDSYREEL